MIPIERILGFALREESIMIQIGEALRSDLVTPNSLYRGIIEFADDFSRERRKLPQAGDWQLWLSSLPENRRVGSTEALGRLQSQTFEEFDPEFFAEQVLSALKETATRTALARLNSVGEITPEALRIMTDRVEAITAGSIIGLADLSDLDLWAHPPLAKDLIPTGIAKLDQIIGGWGKELWMIFADSGVGKSIWLQNCGASALQKGKRVVHITLELGLQPLIHRYYRQIARITKAEFIQNPQAVRGKLDHWFRYASGELFLLEFPAYAMDPYSLQKVLSRIERTKGPLDMIILDYIDLLIPPPGLRLKNDYEAQGKITHMVRSYCPAFDAAVLTATQAIRKPEKKNRLSLRDVGDSYGKVRGSDGFLSLLQNEEELQHNMGRLGVLKSRESGGHSEFPLYVNKEMALIADLDHPNTKQLMSRLGQTLPTPKEKESDGLKERVGNGRTDSVG